MENNSYSTIITAKAQQELVIWRPTRSHISNRLQCCWYNKTLYLKMFWRTWEHQEHHLFSLVIRFSNWVKVYPRWPLTSPKQIVRTKDRQSACICTSRAHGLKTLPHIWWSGVKRPNSFEIKSRMPIGKFNPLHKLCW